VKHLEVKMLKAFQQELTRPSPSCVPPYHLGWKINYDDNIVIILEAMSRRINFVQ
jgi:hypothetical protein